MPTNTASLQSVIQSVQAKEMDPALVARCRRWSRICGTATALLGSTVLLGWLLDVATLKSVLPIWVSMKPNTALGFAMAGAALLLSDARRIPAGGRRAASLLASGITLLGVLTLTEYALDSDFGIDQFLFHATPDPHTHSPIGRMALATAIGLTTTGLALLLRHERLHRFLFQAMAVVGNLIGLLATLGYAFDVKALYGFFVFSTVAMHTALAFMVINVGILLSRPQIGLLGVLTSTTAGGVMARRLLPFALYAPLIIGWLRMQAGHRQLVDVDFGIAMVTVTYIVVLLLFIWRTADALRQSDLQRRVADEMRHLQRGQLSGIINSAMDAIIMVNAAQRVVVYNPAAQHMFGHTAAAMLDQPLEQLLPESFRRGHAEKVRHFDATGVSQRRMGRLGTVTGLRANGEEFPIEASISKLDVNGETYYTVILRDITLRQQMETQLQSAAARMEMAVRSTGIGIWVWHLDSGVLDWDRRMLEIYGAPDSVRDTRLYYDFWASRVHPDDVQAAEQKLAAHVAGTDVYDTEFRIVRSDGQLRYIHAVGILELDDKGRPSQMVGTNRDITESKQSHIRISEINASLELQVAERTAALTHLNATLEEKVQQRSQELSRAMDAAQQANQAKSDFLANMSHEIRTPMNAILGLIYLLEKQRLAPSVRDMVGSVRTAGRALLGIINDILDFSKIEAKHLEIESVPFRLSDVLDNLAGIMASAVGDKDIELLVAPAPHGADYLRGDALRLGQVLINLAGNAIKFTHSGEVVVRIDCADRASPSHRRHLRFTVSDTGVGIPPEQHEKIFNAFNQADTSTTRHFGGTGLGLTISRNLVELMGGTLSLTSTVGQGSSFSFALDFETSNPTASATPSLAHQRILIVDDNATARALLTANAESLGWNAKSAASGAEAIDIALAAQSAQKPFDILMLDWRMPGLNGIETAMALRQALGDTRAPVIVMVTAHDREQLVEQRGSSVADAIVTKPLTTSSLFNAVTQARSARGETPSTRENPEGTVERLCGLNILVVDDSEINRQVAYQILHGEGAEVTLAEDGQQALALLKAQPAFFHIVLMDVQMPVMDGYTATRAIRNTPSLRHLPVVALTAGAFRSHQSAALAAGMDDFIAKPFEVETLIALVQDVTRGVRRHAPPTPHSLPPATALAQTPWLDWNAGIATWREQSVYQKHLGLFAESHAHDVQHIEAQLRAGQIGAAKDLVHRLRGAAGALSLRRLYQLTSRLEDALTDGADGLEACAELPTAMAGSLDRIADYLRTTTHAVEAQETANPKTTPRLAPVDRDAALRHVLAALQSDDPSVIEPTLPALAGVFENDAYKAICACVDTFDFRGAETLVHTLVANE